MQITNLWGLLLLGLIPVLILIHSLKPKPKRIKTSSFYLWQNALKDKKGGFRLLKLNPNLPLLFQVLFILLCALALMNPVWIYESDIDGNVVMVIDTSASMNTITNDGTRFEKARQKALEVLKNLSDVNQVMVIEAANKPILHQNFTNDSGQTEKIISELKPTEMPGKLLEAVYFGLSLMNHDQGDQIFVFTDGAGPEGEKLQTLGSAVKIELVTGGNSNIGITKFNIRPDIEILNRYELILEIRNFNEKHAICPVNIFLKDQVIYSKTVGLKAGEKKLLVFPYQGEETGVIEAKLEINDDFIIDNTARTIIVPPQKLKILLAGKENYFLQKFLSASSNVDLKVNTTENPVLMEPNPSEYDILILDRIHAPKIEQGNIIAIQSFIYNLPFELEEEVIQPVVQDWDHLHPILKNVDLNGVKILESFKLKNHPEVRSIVDSDKTGLVYTHQTKSINAVFIGFNLLKSDLPLKVAFPLLMENAIQWLAPNPVDRNNYSFQTGESIPINLGVGTDQFLVRNSVGELESFNKQSSKFTYHNTVKTGVYTVIEGPKQTRFAVNLNNATESNIRSTYEAGEIESGEINSDPYEVEFFLWIILIIISTFVLIFEWYFWYKKQTV